MCWPKNRMSPRSQYRSCRPTPSGSEARMCDSCFIAHRRDLASVAHPNHVTGAGHAAVFAAALGPKCWRCNPTHYLSASNLTSPRAPAPAPRPPPPPRLAEEAGAPST
jgi:hypothetical protein